MAERIGSVGVDLGLNTARFEEGTKRAVKQARSFGRDVRRAMNFAAVGLALQQLTSRTREAAREMSEIATRARIAGTSAEEFQKLAFAARTVHIEQEKLADIYKDARDRVGDFLTTGGGPLADFFEKVAPQINLTAEELRHLSGPQILGRVISAMEEAGLSANEMTFHLEALASDATQLLPLYRRNAHELRRLGDQAERTGAIFSNRIVAQGDKMERQFIAVTEVLNTQFKSALIDLAPAVNELGDAFAWMAAQVGGGTRVIQQFFEMRVGKEFLRIKGRLQEVNEQLAEYRERAAQIAEQTDKPFEASAPRRFTVEIQRLEEEAERLQNRLDELRPRVKDIWNIGEGGGPAPGTGDGGGAGGGDTPGGVVLPATPREKPDFEGLAADRLEALEDMLSTETERIQEEYQRRLEILREAEEMELETHIGFDELRARAYEDLNDRMQDITERRIRAEMRLERRKTDLALSSGRQLADALASFTEEGFYLQRAAAIAETIIQTHRGVQEALPNIPLAAFVAAAGAANVAAIAATTFSSRSSGGGGAAGGGLNPAGQEAVPPQAQQSVYISLTGGPTYTRESVMELLGHVADVSADGGGPKIVVSNT